MGKKISTATVSLLQSQPRQPLVREGVHRVVHPLSIEKAISKEGMREFPRRSVTSRGVCGHEDDNRKRIQEGKEHSKEDSYGSQGSADVLSYTKSSGEGSVHLGQNEDVLLRHIHELSEQLESDTARLASYCELQLLRHSGTTGEGSVKGSTSTKSLPKVLTLPTQETEETPVVDVRNKKLPHCATVDNKEEPVHIRNRRIQLPTYDKYHINYYHIKKESKEDDELKLIDFVLTPPTLSSLVTPVHQGNVGTQPDLTLELKNAVFHKRGAVSRADNRELVLSREHKTMVETCVKYTRQPEESRNGRNVGVVRTTCKTMLHNESHDRRIEASQQPLGIARKIFPGDSSAYQNSARTVGQRNSTVRKSAVALTVEARPSHARKHNSAAKSQYSLMPVEDRLLLFGKL